MQSSRAAVVVVMASAIVMVSCDSLTGRVTAKRVEACSLLTKADVEGAVGEAVTDAKAGTTRDGESECSWGWAARPHPRVGLTVIGAKQFNTMKSMSSDTKGFRSIPGIGNDAFTAWGAVFVLKNGAAISIQVEQNPPDWVSDDIRREKGMALADKAASRL
jgi:hypothetical protein